MALCKTILRSLPSMESNPTSIISAITLLGFSFRKEQPDAQLA
ncbi:uncharacterized protein An02g10020 [Aspergillus niger]|uniref:Contig An02c0310, genomic contig n=2 Tax=Aspergillus niger TaxID=5061 RepID=A5AAA8_ASPNC|nr:uncharacterized protein An02g10020 [Aspergillus niger]CAK44350.1 unnamed protein product [Aspergillus niger]